VKNSIKLGPYFLILCLVLSIVFIGGVRYGQKVEKINKIVSLPPTVAPTIIPTMITYDDYINNICKFRFVYPKDLTLISATDSALFKKNNTEAISITCFRSLPKGDSFNAVTEKQIKLSVVNQTITANIVKDKSNEYYLFILTHPITKQYLVVKILKEFYPLFSASLKML